jgi:hypothetical protein
MRASLATVVAVLFAAPLLAPAARAEDVVTVSGARYDAYDVVLLEDGVRFSFTAGEGRATLTLPFDRISGQNLLDLLSARAPSKDGSAQLRVARVALARGLLPAAAARFRRAAQVDPSLAGERDLGLAAVQDAETAELLADAEREVRRGRNDLAVEKARRAAVRAPEGSALRLKAEGIVDLAGRLADRDRERAAKASAEKVAKAQAAERAAFDAFLRAADKALAAALGHRGRAADPDVSASSARGSLEAADGQLREARRQLALSRDNPAARTAEIDPRDDDALSLLLANHLDLADLYRAERRFDKARDRVRSVLVLDPQNGRAQTTADRIEQDARVPVQPPYDGGYYDAGWSTGYALPGVPYVRRYSVVSPYPYVSPYFRSNRLLHGSWGGGGFSWRW